eukprot:4775715-Prymnesium_polylepis.1
MYARSFRFGPLGAWTWWISRAGGLAPSSTHWRSRSACQMCHPHGMTARAPWWWRRWRWLRERAFGAAAA